MKRLSLLPLVGALPWMMRDPLSFLVEVSRTHGPVVDLGTWFSGRTYFLAHPNSVQHVLLTHAENYVKGKGFAPMKLLTGEGLVTAEGTRWQRNRRLIQPAFHRQRIAELTDTIVEVAMETSERWNALAKETTLDLSLEMTQLTRSVLMRAVLGVREPAQVQRLSDAWEDALEVISHRLLIPIQPPLSWPTPKNRKLRRARDVLDQTAYDVLRQQREKRSSRGNLLTLLLDARDEETGAYLSDEELRDEVMTFFAGGFETSAMSLAWTFHLLQEHPEAEQKLRRELEQQLGNRRLSAADLPQLPFLKAVVQETMRLYPGAWILLRENLEEDEICGVKIKKGSRLVISSYATHRLPQFWEKPDEFVPERFLVEPMNVPRFAYFPFGGGARQCIGDIFALTEVMVIAAVLLQRHRMSRVPGHSLVPKPMGSLRTNRGPIVTLSSMGRQGC